MWDVSCELQDLHQAPGRTRSLFLERHLRDQSGLNNKSFAPIPRARQSTNFDKKKSRKKNHLRCVIIFMWLKITGTCVFLYGQHKRIPIWYIGILLCIFAQNINDEMKRKIKFSLYSQVKENFLFILSKVLLDIPSVTLKKFEI